jgi:hypothetical protein
LPNSWGGQDFHVSKPSVSQKKQNDSPTGEVLYPFRRQKGFKMRLFNFLLLSVVLIIMIIPGCNTDEQRKIEYDKKTEEAKQDILRAQDEKIKYEAKIIEKTEKHVLPTKSKNDERNGQAE